MKHLTVAGVVLFSLAVMGQPASAADAPGMAGAESAPMAAAAFDWSGGYVGLNAGGGWSKSANCYSTAPCTPEGNVDGSGFVGGGHLGFNVQSGSLVYGAEADLFGTGIEGDDGAAGGYTDQMKIPVMGSIRARLGVAADRTLFFATGGAAYARIESNALPPAPVRESIKTDAWGWTVGAGVEHAFGANWTARVEYRFADFGDRNFAHPANSYIERFKDVQVHMVLAGVSFHW